jgi:hypothetical protein
VKLKGLKDALGCVALPTEMQKLLGLDGCFVGSVLP